MLASTEDETMTTQTQAQIRQAVAALAARLEDHFQRPTEIRKNPNGDSATAFILEPATHDAGLGLGVRVTSTGGLEYKVFITAAFVAGGDFGQKSPQAGYAFFICPSADDAWTTMLGHMKPSVYGGGTSQ